MGHDYAIRNSKYEIKKERTQNITLMPLVPMSLCTLYMPDQCPNVPKPKEKCKNPEKRTVGDGTPRVPNCAPLSPKPRHRRRHQEA